MEFDFSNIEEWLEEIELNDRSKLQLRVQRPTDRNGLWELVSSFSEETLRQIPDRFSQDLVERWIKTLNYEQILPIVAIAPNGKLVCNAVLHLSTNEMTQHRGYYGIWIHDDYQGKGLGTLITKLIIQIGKTKGLKKISLDVFATNKRAIHVYKKCGFEVEGLLKKEIYHYLTKTYMDCYRMAIYF